jgi:hypothetical protein
MGARMGGTHKSHKFYLNVDVRAVRLWHWRKAMSSRRTANSTSIRWLVNQANVNADFHIKCVQALNDCPGCVGTTAEQDDLLFPAPPNNRGSKRNG